MKKILKLMIIMIAIGAIGSLSSVFASCPVGGLLFGHYTYAPADNGMVQTPGANICDTTFLSKFWDHTTGVPAIGLGNDSGAVLACTDPVPKSSWMKWYGAGSYYYIYGDWGNPGYDGCYYPTGTERMVMKFDDISEDERECFMAVAVVDHTPGERFEFDYDDARDSGASNDIMLQPIPALSLSGGTVDVSGNAIVDVNWTPPTYAFYTDGVIAFSSVVVGYDIYKYTAYTEPVTCNPSPWTYLYTTTGGEPPIMGLNIQNSASGDMLTWIALRVNYDSGYQTAYLGPWSSPIAGPDAVGGFASVEVTFIGKHSFKIDWTTAAEYDNAAYFNIHRSRDMANWEVVASNIPATNNIDGASYFRNDMIEKPKGNTFYYKIELVNTTGSGIFSNVVEASFGKPAK